MERQVNIHIEQLPEGFYLATSNNLQGLVAQERTVTETLGRAKEIARMLLEVNGEKPQAVQFIEMDEVSISNWSHMGKLLGVNHQEIIEKLKGFGFEATQHTTDNYIIWHNTSTNKFTTVPNQPEDVPEGTLRAILEQAHITPDEFL